MSIDLDQLESDMAQAIADEDYERAAKLRDEIAAAGLGSRIHRQVPGKMGLGTDQQVYKPPPGWTPPRKPDPLTAHRKRRRGDSESR
jgi:hypothetical protein